MPGHSVFRSTVGNRSPRSLERDLSRFSHRFPVSGRIVNAIARETGGVLGLAERLDRNGVGDASGLRHPSGRPNALPPEKIREVFDPGTIDSVARSLGIPRESVEIQAALGIPKFFTSLESDPA